MSASSYASQKEGKYSIDEVMEQVFAYVNYGSNEHFIATELFINKQQREMDVHDMPSNHRMEWLTRKYITKYGN
jgi:hypothetical protein